MFFKKKNNKLDSYEKAHFTEITRESQKKQENDYAKKLEKQRREIEKIKRKLKDSNTVAGRVEIDKIPKVKARKHNTEDREILKQLKQLKKLKREKKFKQGKRLASNIRAYGGVEIKKISGGIEKLIKSRKDKPIIDSPASKETDILRSGIYYWIIGRDGMDYKLQGAYNSRDDADKVGYKQYTTYTIIPLHTDSQTEAVEEIRNKGLIDESSISKYILMNS